MKKIVFLLLILLFLTTGCSVKKADEVTDAEIFASEYAISKDHVFRYASISDIVDLFDSGTGVIFFGNSDQEESLNILKMFSSLIEKEEIGEVLYFNPVVIRDDMTNDYDRLTTLLGDNLTITDEGDSYLEVPSVYFVKDGEIIGYNSDAAKIAEVEEEKLESFYKHLKKEYLTLINQYLGKENIE